MRAVNLLINYGDVCGRVRTASPVDTVVVVFLEIGKRVRIILECESRRFESSTSKEASYISQYTCMKPVTQPILKEYIYVVHQFFDNKLILLKNSVIYNNL